MLLPDGLAEVGEGSCEREEEGMPKIAAEPSIRNSLYASS